VLGILMAVFLGARTIASYVIDYQWWKEMGQVPTWFSMLLYGMAPALIASLLAFVVLWWVHARGAEVGRHGVAPSSFIRQDLHGCDSRAGGHAGRVHHRFLDRHPFLRRPQPSRRGHAWRDPVFAHPLSFYLFELPFYSDLLRFVLGLLLLSGIIYFLTSRLWQLRERFPNGQRWRLRFFRNCGSAMRSRSVFLRSLGAIFLLALAVRFFLDRYSMLHNDHGFLVGVDYVNQNVSLPLQWLAAAAAAAAAVFLAIGQRKLALAMVAVLVVRAGVPPLVNRGLCETNEISLQRPFVERHIAATRSAYGLTKRIHEVDFAAKLESEIDPARHKPLLDNVRLWDWRAFHDTVTQIQAIRPYYVFADSDVDRYMIDGQLRQVLLTPRELDIRQVGGAQAGWVNSKFRVHARLRRGHGRG